MEPDRPADITQLADNYITLLMDGLKTHATPGKHANVLLHIMGYFKDQLDASDKRELVELVDQYRQGLLPLIAPVTLINHYLRRFPAPYIGRQVYLEPHPRELLLMNL